MPSAKFLRDLLSPVFIRLNQLPFFLFSGGSAAGSCGVAAWVLLLATGLTLGVSPSCSCNGMAGMVVAVLGLLVVPVSLALEKLSEAPLGTLCSSVITIGVAKAIFSAA